MAKTGSKELGPLGLLPGKWKGNRTGWNMIALPFDGGLFKYRILMNQYDEALDFTFVGENVENRGLEEVLESSNNPPGSPEDDQFVVALDYQQAIKQRFSRDRFRVIFCGIGFSLIPPKSLTGPSWPSDTTPPPLQESLYYMTEIMTACR